MSRGDALHPDADPRYATVQGCRQLAAEMDRLAHSARLLVRRHEGWAKALRSRADKIDEAETLELEAKAARMKADGVANVKHKPLKHMLDPFHWLFDGVPLDTLK